jgi:hypothetical protein
MGTTAFRGCIALCYRPIASGRPVLAEFGPLGPLEGRYAFGCGIELSPGCSREEAGGGVPKPLAGSPLGLDVFVFAGPDVFCSAPVCEGVVAGWANAGTIGPKNIAPAKAIPSLLCIADSVCRQS